MRSLAKYALLLALMFAGVPLLADNHVAEPLYDIVAVGYGPGEILLATLAAPGAELRWRFRRIAIAPTRAVVRSAILSDGGTKLLVVLSGGTTSVLDLTERIAELTPERVQVPQHRLPGQRFPLASAEMVCLLDDSGALVQNTCKDAAAAVIGQNGRVLYALADSGASVWACYASAGRHDFGARVADRNPYQQFSKDAEISDW